MSWHTPPPKLPRTARTIARSEGGKFMLGGPQEFYNRECTVQETYSCIYSIREGDTLAICGVANSKQEWWQAMIHTSIICGTCVSRETGLQIVDDNEIWQITLMSLPNVDTGVHNATKTTDLYKREHCSRGNS